MSFSSFSVALRTLTSSLFLDLNLILLERERESLSQWLLFGKQLTDRQVNHFSLLLNHLLLDHTHTYIFHSLQKTLTIKKNYFILSSYFAIVFLIFSLSPSSSSSPVSLVVFIFVLPSLPLSLSPPPIPSRLPLLRRETPHWA